MHAVHLHSNEKFSHFVVPFKWTVQHFYERHIIAIRAQYDENISPNCYDHSRWMRIKYERFHRACWAEHFLVCAIIRSAAWSASQSMQCLLKNRRLLFNSKKCSKLIFLYLACRDCTKQELSRDEVTILCRLVLAFLPFWNFYFRICSVSVDLEG